MDYLSLFSGIGTAEVGIEQAYANYNQYESTNLKAQSGWNGDVDINENSLCVTDHAALRRNAACIGFSEIDKYATSIYHYHWPEVKNYGDATRIICNELPNFDFLVGGFPCQAFSIAGKRKGFEDTRGTLFFEIARILATKRPRHFLLENVAGLLSHNNGQTFRTIIATLDEIGYDIEWTIINSKHHGVPQNRERVFIIGHPRNGSCRQILSFGYDDSESDEIQRESRSERERLSVDTESRERDTSISDKINVRGERYSNSLPYHKLDGEISSALDANYYKGSSNGFGGRSRQLVSNELREITDKERQGNRRYDSLGLAATLNANAGGKGGKTGLYAIGGLQEHQTWRDDGISPSLTEAMGKGGGQTPIVISPQTRIRRLTPTECERLQGLSDGHTLYGKDANNNLIPVSDSQRYKCLGNAMTVNVIEAIITKMLEQGCLQ